MFTRPDVAGLRRITRRYVQLDRYIQASIEDGFITEEQLVIGRYVSDFLNLNGPDLSVNKEVWLRNLPIACQAAAEEFGITKESAKEFFEKADIVRSRHMDKANL
jgi:hypothetical protein